jgi:hypothetical protein
MNNKLLPHAMQYLFLLATMEVDGAVVAVGA